MTDADYATQLRAAAVAAIKEIKKWEHLTAEQAVARSTAYDIYLTLAEPERIVKLLDGIKTEQGRTDKLLVAAYDDIYVMRARLEGLGD